MYGRRQRAYASIVRELAQQPNSPRSIPDIAESISYDSKWIEKSLRQLDTDGVITRSRDRRGRGATYSYQINWQRATAMGLVA